MNPKEKAAFETEIMQSLHNSLSQFTKGSITQEQLEKKYYNIMNSVMKRSKEYGIQFAIKHHSLEFSKGYNVGISECLDCINVLPMFEGDAKYVKSRRLGDELFIEKESLIVFLEKQKL